jgi:hypothetical protein
MAMTKYEKAMAGSMAIQEARELSIEELKDAIEGLKVCKDALTTLLESKIADEKEAKS